MVLGGSWAAACRVAQLVKALVGRHSCDLTENVIERGIRGKAPGFAAVDVKNARWVGFAEHCRSSFREGPSRRLSAIGRSTSRDQVTVSQ